MLRPLAQRHAERGELLAAAPICVLRWIGRSRASIDDPLPDGLSGFTVDSHAPTVDPSRPETPPVLDIRSSASLLALALAAGVTPTAQTAAAPEPTPTEPPKIPAQFSKPFPSLVVG